MLREIDPFTEEQDTSPPTSQDPESATSIQKSRKIEANPCQNPNPTKLPHPHDTGNNHNPKTSPLANTGKK